MPPDPSSRPASRALAAEVTRKVRERGLVVWVDAERQYTGLVDALREGAFGFPYPVAAYRDSYLELDGAQLRRGVDVAELSVNPLDLDADRLPSTHPSRRPHGVEDHRSAGTIASATSMAGPSTASRRDEASAIASGAARISTVVGVSSTGGTPT
jgi:hypothetical protein